MIEGTEYCGYCEGDFNFEVEDDVWIVPCKVCGRPTILCDKCHSLGMDDKCGGCQHEKKLIELLDYWEKEQIGKILWLENGFGAGWYRVIGFNNGAYHLKELDGENIVDDFGKNIDYDKVWKEN